MNRIKEETLDAFKKLLPDSNLDDVARAIDECYYDGVEAIELTKTVYAYLYPVKEPSLFEEDKS